MMAMILKSDSPSLRDLDRTADRIRLQWSTDRKPILVVEGPSDLFILTPHLPEVQIYPADGKGGALQTIRQLRSWGVHNAIAVIDRDFDDPNDIADIAEAIHPYDGRDLEGMLINIGVLALVLEHQGSRDKIQALSGIEAVVQILKDNVGSVTALRSANASSGLLLSFSKFDLARKFDADSLKLLTTDYCLGLIAISDTQADLATLLEAIAAYSDDGYGPRGKDVISAAGVALRKAIGGLPTAATKESVLTPQIHSSSGLAISRSEWLRVLRNKLGGVDSLAT